MTNELRDEIVGDIITILKKFGIDEQKIIDEDFREDLTTRDLELLGYPNVFFSLNDHKAFSGGIDYVDKKYRYNTETKVLLSLESRDKAFNFDNLVYFFSNLQETTNYFRDRKNIRMIKSTNVLSDTNRYFENRKYFKKVIEFTYYAEILIEEEIWQ